MNRKNFQIPKSERQRLESLINYNIIEKLSEKSLVPFVRQASYISQAPYAIVFISEEQRNQIKAQIGLNIYDLQNSFEFCIQIANGEDFFEVTDTLHNQEFSRHRMVIGQPALRYIAGYPLRTQGGISIGCLCVMDTKPKKLNPEQVMAFKSISEEIMLQV